METEQNGNKIRTENVFLGGGGGGISVCPRTRLQLQIFGSNGLALVNYTVPKGFPHFQICISDSD